MAKSTIKKGTAPGVSTTAERATRSTAKEMGTPEPLIFGRQNFIWIGIGAVLIAVGLLLMLGGQQVSPDVWDENVIYSFRIVTLAPIVILAGLIVEIYAIFKD
ncbi:MAG: DUF3098 domain-containing protein [Saprospiraceae bacterium]